MNDQFRAHETWHPVNSPKAYRVTLETNDVVWLTPVGGGHAIQANKYDTRGWVLVGREDRS